MPLFKLAREWITMDQEHKKAFWRFAIKYNVVLLGALYFASLAIMTSAVIVKIEGEMAHGRMLVFVFILLVAFVSWVCCVWKSWKLTKFDSKLRMGTMAYLFGAPLFLLLISWQVVIFILRLMGVSVPLN